MRIYRSPTENYPAQLYNLLKVGGLVVSEIKY